MKNIDKYKNRFYSLLESEMGNVKPLITEEINILGRKTVINPDGTISISDKSSKMKKIRLTTKLGNINIINIENCTDGYKITGKSGKSQCVNNSKIKQIIDLIDSNQNQGIIKSDSVFIPNLNVQIVGV